MSWEARKGEGRYYTRSRRHDGRVVREYIGTGEVAALAAQMDALDRQERRAAIEARRQRNASAAALDAQVASVVCRTDLLARAMLIAAGYHQHHRGPWRKRREKSSQTG